MVFVSAFLMLGAGVTCAIQSASDEELASNNATVTAAGVEGGSSPVTVTAALTVEEDNVFDHNGGGTRHLRWLQAEEATIAPTESATANMTSDESEIFPYELEYVCQDISYYGNFAFAFCCFFFWYAASKVLRRGARKHKYNLSGTFNEDTKVWGVQTIMAITLIPWVSFAIGSLYPVWVWLASDFSNTYWLEVALKARSGIVQHYGLCLMAMLSHNWFKTMTYRVDDTSLLSSNVFHDRDFPHPRLPRLNRPPSSTLHRNGTNCLI